jgi:cysteine synthase A
MWATPNAAAPGAATRGAAPSAAAPATAPPPSAVATPAAPCAFAERGCGMHDLSERMLSLWNMIGGTPLLQIRYRVRGADRCVYAKFEAASLTGSIKDRLALYILESAYERGEIQTGDVIVEASSGNTGISFAAVGRALGHPVRIYMPDWMSRERTLVIESLGAEIVPVSAAEGGFPGSIELADRFAADHPHTFRPRQFDNRDNVEAHRQTTAPELLAQLRSLSFLPTAFVAGVGTGGTLVGVGEYLTERLGNVAIHPLEPANSPTLRTGTKRGAHRIQGVSDDFVPSIVRLDRWSPVVDVWDGDAILMAQRLARELGVAVGISSGANFLGAVQVIERQGPSAVVATVFPDDNKKYLSTDLCREEPVLEHYLSPGIELVGVRAVPRTMARRTPLNPCRASRT